MNWYKNHTVYEFILYNLYNNCIQKLAKKRFASGLGFQPIEMGLGLPSEKADYTI